MSAANHKTEDQAVAKIRHAFEIVSQTASKGSQAISPDIVCTPGSENGGGTDHFDSDLMRRARVIEASSAGSAVVEIEVGMEYSNSAGLLHGGAAALILDQFTTTAFIPVDSYDIRNEGLNPPGGVTRSLNVTYLRPLQLPATLVVESRILQMGKASSLVVGSIRRIGDPKLYCVCEHHKMALRGPGRKGSEEKGLRGKL